jgi:hypothetical protein
MPDDTTRTVLVALLAGIGVTLAKIGAAVFTGSTALAAEAAHPLADNANDLRPAGHAITIGSSWRSPGSRLTPRCGLCSWRTRYRSSET